MKKKQSTAHDAGDLVLKFKVDTARPGDVVFISPGRPLTERAMQHLNARFKAANLGVKVVVLQHGHAVTIETAPAGADETIEERAREKYAVSSAEWSTAPAWEKLDEGTRDYYRKAVHDAAASERIAEDNAG